MAIGLYDLSSRVNVLDDTTVTLIDHGPVVAGGSPIQFTLSDNYLSNKKPDNPQLNDPETWNKVILAYSSPGLNQFKSLTFRRSGGTMQCVESWSSYAISGAWAVQKVYIVGHDGALMKIDGTDFSTDTITVS